MAQRTIFANTAVDRIVPNQAADAGLDVTVETYFEWAIETPPFGEPDRISRLPIAQSPSETWLTRIAPIRVIQAPLTRLDSTAPM